MKFFQTKVSGLTEKFKCVCRVVGLTCKPASSPYRQTAYAVSSSNVPGKGALNIVHKL